MNLIIILVVTRILRIKNREKIVFLINAGISEESGISNSHRFS